MPVPKTGVTKAFFSTITDFLLKLFIYFSFIHFMSRLKLFDNVCKNGALSNHFFFHISRNIMITLLILLVSLYDCLPYLDENIHLYEAQCLTKYFAKWEDKNLEKRNK